MNELKLKLTSTKTVEDKKIELYEIADYTVKVVSHDCGLRWITIREHRSEYLPTIYCRDDMEGNVLGFEIQTTSYGSLPITEIKKMVEALEMAVEVAEILTKEFVSTQEVQK